MPVTASLIVGGSVLAKGAYDYFSGSSKERKAQKKIDATLQSMKKYNAPTYKALTYQTPSQVKEYEDISRSRLSNIPSGIPGQDIYEQKMLGLQSAANYNVTQSADNPLAATGAVTDIYGRTLGAIQDLNLRSAEYRSAIANQRYADYANALSQSANYGNIAQSFNANQQAMQYESERAGALAEYNYNVVNPANIRLGLATNQLQIGQNQSMQGINAMFSAPIQGLTTYTNLGGQLPKLNMSNTQQDNTKLFPYTS